MGRKLNEGGSISIKISIRQGSYFFEGSESHGWSWKKIQQSVEGIGIEGVILPNCGKMNILESLKRSVYASNFYTNLDNQQTYEQYALYITVLGKKRIPVYGQLLFLHFVLFEIIKRVHHT